MIVVLEDSRARFFRLENSGRLADGLPDIASGIDGSTGLPAERTEKRKRYLTAVMTAVEQACEGNECDRLMAVGPERMLSAFRRAASDKVKVRLWREAAMNVRDATAAELEARLAPHFR